MTFVTRFLLAALALSAPALAYADKKADKKDDAGAELKKLEGSWKVKSMEFGGKKIPEPEFAKMRLTFKGNTLIIEGSPHGRQETTFEIDPSKKPAQITIQPPKGEEKPLKAIYKIEKNTLTICGTDTGDQPTEFASKEGSNIGLMVLERVKDKE